MSGTLPLFEKYPALSGLPYVRLGLFPTPVQELHGLSESDNRVFIKRDDLSGLEYGGNKVRKLEFALGEAKANGCTDVITFGCDGSNHALATGIYAGKLGMHSISILRTQHNTRYLRKNLLKSAFYGIELHHCETKQEMDALTIRSLPSALQKGKKHRTSFRLAVRRRSAPRALSTPPLSWPDRSLPDSSQNPITSTPPTAPTEQLPD